MFVKAILKNLKASLFGLFILNKKSLKTCNIEKNNNSKCTKFNNK